MRFLRYKALKSVMGTGRVGPGREYSDFSLKYERTRSARCARSLVITCVRTSSALCEAPAAAAIVESHSWSELVYTDVSGKGGGCNWARNNSR